MAYDYELSRGQYRFDDEYHVRATDPDLNPATDVPKDIWRFHDAYVHMTLTSSVPSLLGYGKSGYGEGSYGT